MNLNGARWIELQNIIDSRGALSVIDAGAIPFQPARVFFVYGVPADSERAGHSHRTTHQFVVSLAGTFQLDLTDGVHTSKFSLSERSRGVYVPPMIWDRLYGFSADAVCLVLSSTAYNEADYIRNWDEFLRLRKEM